MAFSGKSRNGYVKTLLTHEKTSHQQENANSSEIGSYVKMS